MEDNLQEVQNAPKPKKKKKYIISLVIIAVILLTGVCGFLFYQHQQKKIKQEYAMNLAITSVDMLGDFLIISYIVSLNSEVWDNAIDKRTDFNKAVNNFVKTVSEGEVGIKLKGNQDSIRSSMQLLQNPPKEYEESYLILKEMYGVYTKMYEQAFSPTGSLIEYNRKTNEYFSEFEKLKEEFLITLPIDVKKLKEKYEDEKEEENEEKEESDL